MKNRQNFTCLFIIFFLSVTQHLFAVTITAINNNGNWNSSTTWSLNRKPSNKDRVIIPENITVKITSRVYIDELPELTIKIYGKLKFIGSTAQLNLKCGSSVCALGCDGEISSTGNSNNRITIGGLENVLWKGTDCDFKNDCLEGDCSLPVLISKFEAVKVSNGVEINWTTSMEDNFAYFELERSTDGTGFEKIATINISGNSVYDYSFTDHAIHTGTVYYRLKNIDRDATFNWSDIISIELNPAVRISTFPNPASSENLFLNADDANGETLQVFIFDYTGKEYFSDSFIYEFPTQLYITKNITPGFYVLEVRYKNTRLTEKIRIE